MKRRVFTQELKKVEVANQLRDESLEWHRCLKSRGPYGSEGLVNIVIVSTNRVLNFEI